MCKIRKKFKNGRTRDWDFEMNIILFAENLWTQYNYVFLIKP